MRFFQDASFLIVVLALAGCSGSARVSAAPSQTGHEAASDGETANPNMYLPEWTADPAPNAVAGASGEASGRRVRTIGNSPTAVYAKSGGGKAPAVMPSGTGGDTGASTVDGDYARVEGQNGR